MNEIRQWLDSGAEVQQGLRLLNIYAPNEHLARLVTLNPSRYKQLLVRTLTAKAAPEIAQPVVHPRRFREDWPFLQDPGCPNELKILAADKITAYRNYVSAHEQLYDCTSPKECYAVAKKLIENYIENRKIHSELAYFKEHGNTLGKHPIFDELKHCAELRRLPIAELFRRKENLEGAIWRINSEIRKETKPHLLTSRERRLKSKQRELAEVQQIIASYATL